MPYDARYVLTENIDRFQRLLLHGRLDGDQRGTVGRLLVQAREELADLDRRSLGTPAPVQAGVQLPPAVAIG
jgi:hypothetical protein